MSGLPQDYSYWRMMAQYGLREVLKSPILWGALLSSLAIVVSARILGVAVGAPSVQTAIGIMIGIDGVLLAIVLAGLAIVVSLMDEELLYFLWKGKFLGQLLFVFRSSAYALGGGVILGGALYLALFVPLSSTAEFFVVGVLSWAFLSATIYGILSAINLVSATAYFGIFKARYLETMKKQSHGREEYEHGGDAAGGRTSRNP